MGKRSVIKLILLNPFILSLCNVSMLVHKVKLFKTYGFSSEETGKIFVENPFCVTKSYASLEKKFDYLSKSFKSVLRNQEIIGQLLMKNYGSWINPRGNILTSANETFTLELLNLNDKDFCLKHKILSDEFEKKKFESLEFEIKKREAVKHVSLDVTKTIYSAIKQKSIDN